MLFANTTMSLYPCHGATPEEEALYDRLAYAMEGVGQVRKDQDTKGFPIYSKLLSSSLRESRTWKVKLLKKK